MPTDTSEKGLESLIVKSLIEEAGYLPGRPTPTTANTPSIASTSSPS